MLPSDDIDKTVEGLLSAPESVLNSKAERQKAILRKAREAAAQAQELASKSKVRPSIEDMIEDIVRVAEDPETNPWHKFRAISRRRYVLYGRYPVSFIDRQFGTFAHAKEVANLQDQEGTRMWRSQRANASRNEHAKRQ